MHGAVTAGSERMCRAHRDGAVIRAACNVFHGLIEADLVYCRLMRLDALDLEMESAGGLTQHTAFACVEHPRL